MIRTITVTSALLGVLALPATAQSFRAENRVTVTPVTGGFEAFEGGGMGARSLWCAAADYAKEVRGASGTQRLYVKTARGPSVTQPNRKAVSFTLDPTGLTPSTVLVLGPSIRTPGANLSVDHAYSFCADHRLTNSR